MNSGVSRICRYASIPLIYDIFTTCAATLRSLPSLYQVLLGDLDEIMTWGEMRDAFNAAGVDEASHTGTLMAWRGTILKKLEVKV